MVLSKDMKIAICFGLIMGALISICNMCFASELVETTTINGLAINNTNTYISTSTGLLVYVPIEKGYYYTINNTSAFARKLGFTNEVPAGGVPVYDVHDFVGNDSYSFNSNLTGYLVLVCSGANDSFVITRDELTGMSAFVDDLSYDLSYANLSGVIFFVVPIMAIAILFALGFYLLKRLLNKIKRAKGGA